MTDEELIAEQKYIASMSGRSSSEAPQRPTNLNIVKPQGTFILSGQMDASGGNPLGIVPTSEVDPYNLFTGITSVRNSAGLYTLTFSGSILQSSNFSHNNGKIKCEVRNRNIANKVSISALAAWIGGAGTYQIQVIITHWDHAAGTPGLGDANGVQIYLELSTN